MVVCILLSSDILMVKHFSFPPYSTFMRYIQRVLPLCVGDLSPVDRNSKSSGNSIIFGYIIIAKLLNLDIMILITWYQQKILR